MKWILLGLLLIALPAAAQAPTASAEDKPPALSEVQRLQIQNAAQAMEIWQLKAQQAASEFEKARAHIQELIATVTPKGWQLNDKLEFVKLPDPKAGGS